MTTIKGTPQVGPRIICLTGPTGSGKTGAALYLAAKLQEKGLPATIINADSRQLYAAFPIITAQPTECEQAKSPHLLYGYLNIQEKSTAWQWAEFARAKIESLTANGILPILVGGTGMYLKALLDGFAPIPQPDPNISQTLLAECGQNGPQPLHARLTKIDPDYAGRIHPNDRQRVIRALEVWQSTGKTFTWWHAQTTPPHPRQALRLGMGLPLPELEPFLKRRIDIMLDMGALAEANAALKACPDLKAPGWSGIGCLELGQYLAGQISWESCKERWLHNTRAYAKRQWTWFRADSRIQWFRPGQEDAMLAVLCSFLRAAPPTS